MERTLRLLQEITEAAGLPGHEHEVREVIKKYLPPKVEVTADRLGSLVVKKQGTADRPKVMLAGHMDEIGFLVTHVTKQGFAKFQTLGGWWEQVMLAQRVLILTPKGRVPGVIGSKPPHELEEEERKKVVSKKDMYIDFGASSREKAEEMGVRPGCFVVPDSPFTRMADPDYLMAKAWDDRVGCAMFVDILHELSQVDHPNSVYGVGTVQEEVGLRGATTSARLVDPDVAFALEVAISGDTPGFKEDQGHPKLGHGPAVCLYDSSMVPNTRLVELVVDTAKECDIPIQFEVLSRGGTDAGRIHIHGQGVPSLVVGVPTRYIHSHAGILHLQDYLNAVKLMVAVIRKLDAETVEGLVR